MNLKLLNLVLIINYKDLILNRRILFYSIIIYFYLSLLEKIFDFITSFLNKL